jgi:hypothetical protein
MQRQFPLLGPERTKSQQEYGGNVAARLANKTHSHHLISFGITKYIAKDPGANTFR